MKLSIYMRQVFIDHYLATQRSVCRNDLVTAFGISAQNASLDFKRFREAFPNRMRYSVTDRRHKANGCAVYTHEEHQAVAEFIGKIIHLRMAS